MTPKVSLSKENLNHKAMTLLKLNRRPKGFALNIGINHVDVESSTYQVPKDIKGIKYPALKACENDARAYAKLSVEKDFSQIRLLLGSNATTDNFRAVMADYSKELRKGDLFLLSFSGHGAQVPDFSGDEQKDMLDEVWCFHDSIILDDELYDLWKYFDSGVRIFVVSDSCHSGDMLKGNGSPIKPTGKRMFSEVSDIDSINASVQIFAACRENQVAREKHNETKVWHGAFTNCLLKNLANNPIQSYDSLFKEVQTCVGKNQNPHMEFLGNPKKGFLNEQALTIN